MAKPQVFAYMNHGRWLAKCPVHSIDGAIGVGQMPVQMGEDYIAPCCFRGITAVKPAFIKHRPTIVPDLAARKEARRQAEELNQVYEVVFPVEKTEIEKILRARPQGSSNFPKAHQCFVPGESLEQLRQQNMVIEADENLIAKTRQARKR